jgi:hypothetical protein
MEPRLVSENPVRIWIVRKGNGKAQVYPSPALATTGQDVELKNWTEATAEVRIDDRLAPRLGVHGLTVSIGAGGSMTFHVADGRADYYEYTIDLLCERGEQYVEGSSRPAIIIDP